MFLAVEKTGKASGQKISISRVSCWAGWWPEKNLFSRVRARTTRFMPRTTLVLLYAYSRFDDQSKTRSTAGCVRLPPHFTTHHTNKLPTGGHHQSYKGCVSLRFEPETWPVRQDIILSFSVSEYGNDCCLAARRATKSKKQRQASSPASSSPNPVYK